MLDLHHMTKTWGFQRRIAHQRLKALAGDNHYISSERSAQRHQLLGSFNRLCALPSSRLAPFYTEGYNTTTIRTLINIMPATFHKNVELRQSSILYLGTLSHGCRA